MTIEDEEQLNSSAVATSSYEREFSCCRCDTPTALFVILVIWSLFLVLVTAIVATSFQMQHPNSHLRYAPPCSFHGVWQQDTAACTCFNCASGPSCETLLSSPALCTVDARSSLPFLMEDYWNNYTLAHGYPPAAPFGLNFRVLSPEPPAPLAARLDAAIRLLHLRQRNANTTLRTLVYAPGLLPLWSALCHALAAADAAAPLLPLFLFQAPPLDPTLFRFQPQPFDPTLLRWTDNISSLSSSSSPSSSSSSFFDTNQSLRTIELITAPSSPLGTMMPPTLPRAFARVYDLSNNWPSLTPTSAFYSEDIMLFSLAEASGHAATGFGWALIRDSALAARVADFLHRGALVPSPLTIARVLEIVDALNRPETSYFEDLRGVLSARWQRLLSVLGQSTRFSLHSTPRTAFLVLSCQDPQDAADCPGVFTAAGIDTLPDSAFLGLPPATVTINLLLWHHAFDVFFERFVQLTLR